MLSKAKIKLINQLAQKKYRQQTGLFIAEGHKTVGDMMEYFTPEYLYYTSDYKGNTVAEVVPALYLYINKNAIEETLGESDFTNSLFSDFNLDDNPVVFLFTFKDDISKYVIK